MQGPLCPIYDRYPCHTCWLVAFNPAISRRRSACLVTPGSVPDSSGAQWFMSGNIGGTRPCKALYGMQLRPVDSRQIRPIPCQLQQNLHTHIMEPWEKLSESEMCGNKIQQEAKRKPALTRAPPQTNDNDLKWLRRRAITDERDASRHRRTRCKPAHTQNKKAMHGYFGGGPKSQMVL